ncbi:hypothetical protein [Arthrobacter sp. B3I4]|uniref:hypothetical protein n=1 Tax=Arthrobacter sp. B3I4 TaxID=3042267 RepID=UPI0027880201|nr:hypothetical protein [Arthrobacter sp. B3I4]MDQ0754496.1 hypothetical protein [Arthrobacter sp. B3I4]
MHEADQQALTCTVIRELTLNPYALWLHYVSVGGNFDLQPVIRYIAGSGALPCRERDRISCAVNDLTLEPRWRPRAPYSYADPF